MYTKESIDKVRDTNIVQTIMKYVELKKSGSGYEGFSPFVAEKTPSFKVSQSKQIFKCFSSGKGGDAISFIEAHEKVNFYEAIEIIAKIHSISLERVQETEVAKRSRIVIETMEEFSTKVASIYRNNFFTLEPTHWAKEMINVERGFNDEIQIDFQIGYGLLENQITNYSQETGNFENAKKLGLVNTKESATYDVFKKRVIFPIHNHRGKVVGFGGRRSNDEADVNYAKYLNSKESDIFDKSSILYGLWQAKEAINRKGFAILTEGYTDVIAMHQHFCDNTVASMGTALTEQHLKLLGRYCKHIVVLRDADKPGQAAAEKDLNAGLDNGFTIDVCSLPLGEDPDSFCRKEKDVEAWIDQNKKDGIYWITELLFSEENIVRDNYQREVDDLNESLKINVKALESDIVSVDDLEDIAEIKQAKLHNKTVLADVERFKKEHLQEVKNLVKIDVRKKSDALKKICEILFKIKREAVRFEYIKEISKITEYTPGTIKLEISNLEKEATEKRISDTGKFKSSKKNLPKGADPEEYNEFGFVTINGVYYFENSTGTFFQGSDFEFIPLYHTLGMRENKRVVELVNDAGTRKLIDFESGLLADFGRFRKVLYNLNGFRFQIENGFRTEHFERFVSRFNREFELAKEMFSMGWNKKGCWSFANGTYYKQKFIKANKYGVVKLEGINANENEDSDEAIYNDKIENYYAPAFSVMHKNNEEDDDPYENDRNFIFKQSPVTLIEWQNQMITVFGDKAKIGIIYIFATIFRDLFMDNYRNFPILGCFGEKDSGKSTFGLILQQFFYFNSKALDVSRATNVAFTRIVSRCHNTVIACDEYSDKNVEPNIQQGLMGSYDGMGRPKGMNTGDKRTANDKIYSSLVVMGQWLPAIFDNAFGTRMVSLIFPSLKYTADEKEEFLKLTGWMDAGVSSLIFDILDHRTYFEKQLPIVYNQVTRDLKKEFENKDHQNRILEGVTKLLVTYKILADKINMPFTEADFTDICIKIIIENSEQISDSNGVSEFWKTLEWLYEHGRLREGLQFKIESKASFKVTIGKEEVDYDNYEGNEILFLRLSSAHQDYVKEASTRDGVDIINETTLRNYFKNRSYYIGKSEGKKFEGKNTTSYVFNYTKMKLGNILNLDSQTKSASSLEQSTINMPNEPAEKEDLPF